MKKYSKGFTLIELLVVIAIIGILSSVVLASLNTARGKGSDAAIKSQLAGMRAQAELKYDTDGNIYTNVCTGDATITNALNSARSAAGVTAAINTTAAGGPGLVTCHSVSGGYAIESPLKTAGFYCVDSTGAATSTAASTLGASATDITCG